MKRQAKHTLVFAPLIMAAVSPLAGRALAAALDLLDAPRTAAPPVIDESSVTPLRPKI